MSNILKTINNKIKLHCEQIDLLPIMVILFNIIFTLIYIEKYPFQNDVILFKISTLILILVISYIFFHIAFKNIKNNFILPLYLFIIFIALGFFPFYGAFISGGKKYIILNLSSSLLLLAIILDWLGFIAITVAGVVTAYVVFYFSDSYDALDFLHPSKKFYAMSYIISFMFVSISLFMRRKQNINEKKVDFMEIFGSAIAHEVNGPLAAIKMLSDTLAEISKAAKIEKEANDDITIKINRADYEMLVDTIIPGFKKSSNNAMRIVEMLLATIRSRGDSMRKQITDASLIVRESIKMSRHSNENKKDITVDIQQDFSIKYPRHIVKHLIYNIIKNSFKHGGKNIHVTITIMDHKIIIHDNGRGISKEDSRKIFDLYYTKGNGSGIGLAFSKFVMDDIGGKISCDSELGKYTSFTLCFPKER